MSYSPKMRLPHPETWSAFEDLCWGLWKAIWDDNGAQKNGRNGQRQDGVDVFGRPGKRTAWAGVQCKGKDAYTNQVLTIDEIRSEAEKARGFTPQLSEYTIATTAPRDAALQKCARILSDEYMKVGLFSVDVRGWDDIVDLLFEHEPPIAGKYYPQIFGGELRGLALQLLACGTTLISTIMPTQKQTVFNREGDLQSPRAENNLPDGNDSNSSMPLRDKVAHNISPNTMRMVIDCLYAKQQEISGLATTVGSASSDASFSDALNKARSDHGSQPPERMNYDC